MAKRLEKDDGCGRNEDAYVDGEKSQKGQNVKRYNLRGGGRLRGRNRKYYYYVVYIPDDDWYTYTGSIYIYTYT